MGLWVVDAAEAGTERVDAELAGRLRREDAVVGRESVVGRIEETVGRLEMEEVEAEEDMKVGGGGRVTLESGLRWDVAAVIVVPVLVARPWA